jgi:hypothetical protein
MKIEYMNIFAGSRKYELDRNTIEKNPWIGGFEWPDVFT